MNVVINDISFKIIWSNKMTRTRFKLSKNNVIKISSNLVEPGQLPNVFSELFSSPDFFVDDKKKTWMRGKLLGRGGFSNVFGCSNDRNAVIKIDKEFEKDPRTSVAEIFSYISLGKSELIPTFLGKNRKSFPNSSSFVVLERFEHDAVKLAGNSPEFWNSVARNVIDCLEFIHEKGFVHCDVKPHNILISNSSLPTRAVLGDFGLMKKQRVKENVGWFGTLSYSSLDSHEKKFPSRRSDLESLGWSLVEMFGGVLPWKREKNRERVHSMKLEMMKSETISECFQTKPPESLKEFLKIVWKLEYSEIPNYRELRKLF